MALSMYYEPPKRVRSKGLDLSQKRVTYVLRDIFKGRKGRRGTLKGLLTAFLVGKGRCRKPCSDAHEDRFFVFQ